MTDREDYDSDGVRLVDATTAAAAVEILVGAFYDDPLWAWAFPDAARRREQHRTLWGLFVDGGVRYPWTFLDAAGAATSLWIPPGGTELEDDVAAGVEDVLRDLLGPDGAGRVLSVFESLDDAHPHDTPSYHLSLLGTDPAHRGRGLGLALLQENLARLDALHAAAYLEASNPANVSLYARYGFEPRRTVSVPGGPAVPTMWRDPR